MATEKQLRNNSEYWKKRFQMLEERNHDKADKLSEKLRKEYAKAEKEIEKLTYEWYGRIAANNEVSMDEARKLLKGAELSEFKWTVDQYIKVGSKENLSPAWLKQLENASARAHITRLDAQKVYLRNTIENLYGKEEQLVKSGLMETYEDNLYRTAFEIEKGCGVGVNFAKADPKRIEAVINRPWAQDAETFSDRIWDSKAALATELETQLMQNVMLGRSNEEAVKAIEKRFGVSYRQADRLIRTETAAIASQAQQEAFKELDVEKYEIVATLDNRTSEICQEMDGKVFDMKDYEVGTTAPPFHPNCRSCTAPYLEDDYGETIQRVARDENGKSTVLPEDITYEKWLRMNFGMDEDRLLDTKATLPKEIIDNSLKEEKDIEEQTYDISKQAFNEDDYKYINPDEFTEWKKSCGVCTSNEYKVINKHQKPDGTKGGYVKSHRAWEFNAELRAGMEDQLDEDDKNMLATIRKLINDNRTDRPVILDRFVEYKFADSNRFLKECPIPFNMFREDLVDGAVSWVNENLIGQSKKEDGVVSASYANNVLTKREIHLRIFCPIGTHMFVTKNKRESEVLLHDKLEYDIIKASKESFKDKYHKGDLFRLVLDVMVKNEGLPRVR